MSKIVTGSNFTLLEFRGSNLSVRWYSPHRMSTNTMNVSSIQIITKLKDLQISCELSDLSDLSRPILMARPTFTSMHSRQNTD